MDPTDASPEEGASDGAQRDCGRFDPGELFARAMNTVQPSPGANVWTPPPIEELARLLPQYRIESLLGHGGMGAVYKGWQPTLDRAVAIKLLPAEIAADEEFVARFEREARTLAKLQHPGIVAVYDFGRTAAGHLYFVMEYVDGTDLHKMLRAQPLAPAQALEAICQICDALHHAHSHGVIHRDIKPANILFTREGRAKLADFGIARPTTEGEDTSKLTLSNMVMGTPAYMAPEQQRGHTDLRADIYALGVMLYEMLTGQRPQGIFEMPSRKVAVDTRIDAVVTKALQQEPDRRYQQVSEMQTDVDRIRTTPGQGIRKAVPKVIATVAPARRSPLMLILAIVLPILTLVGWLTWKMEHPSATATATAGQNATLPSAPAPAPATPSPTPQPTPPPAVASTTTPPPPLVTPPDTRPSPRPASESTQPTPAPAPAPEAMEPVLLAHRWSYIGTAPGTPAQHYSMEITFRRGGIVTTANSPDRLHWWITGPRTVHIQREQTPLQFDEKNGADLTFDAPLNKFDGRTSTGHTLTGARLGAAEPEAPAQPSRIADFSDQCPNITGWITSPLEVSVPEQIWENLNFLKEALKDEAAKKPAANAKTYTMANFLCAQMLRYLEERDAFSARAGGTAVLHQKSSLTQQNRDHLTWPQYMLEKDERAERHENARNAPKFMNGNRLVEWNTRKQIIRRQMESAYSELREALRQTAR